MCGIESAMKILSATNDFMKLTFSIFGAAASTVGSTADLVDSCVDVDAESALLGS